jgi:hypothetical protein
LRQGVPISGGCGSPNHSANIVMSKSDVWCQELFQARYVLEIIRFVQKRI